MKNGLPYCVPRVSSELMLEPSELKGVIDVFFRTASSKIEVARLSIQSGELEGWSSNMHALKGVALSLHMNRLGELAAAAEQSDLLLPAALPGIVDQLEIELHDLREAVDAYYRTGI